MHLGRLLGLIWGVGLVAFTEVQAATNNAQYALHQFEAGIASLHGGELKQSVALLTLAIESQKLGRDNRIRALYDRGVAYDSLGDLAAAVSDYSAALQIDPGFAPALNNRANVYRRQGRLDEAWRDYSAALAGSSAAKQYSYYGLGLIAARKGNPSGAHKYFKLALSEDPRFSLAVQGLAALESAPQRYSEKRRTQLAEQLPLRPSINDTAVADPTAKIQLGAFRDEKGANAGWIKVQADSGGVLSGLQPLIAMVTLPGKGQFWRLRTEVTNKQMAEKLCRDLKSKGMPCMLVAE